MSKKQIYSRLNALFSDLEDQPAQSPITQQEQWSWEWDCDFAGQYTFASEAVGNQLGIAARQWSGQPVTEFALDVQSREKIKAAISGSTFPIDLELVYICTNADLLPARVFIRKTEIGFHGMVKAMGKPFADPARKSAKRQPSEPAPAKENVSGFDTNRQSLATPKQDVRTSVERSGGNGHKALSPAIVTDAFANKIHAPFKVGDQSTAILEVVAEGNTRRKWSEDERLLVQEVAAQLALALENARLYSVVQQELSERIRAEQEILQRNYDLAILNQIGQEISAINNEYEIFQVVYQTVGQLVDNRNLTLALWDSYSKELSFPLVSKKGEIVSLPARPASNGIIEHIINTRTTLLIANRATAILQDLGIDLPNHIPASLLALPLITGDRVIGAMLLENFEIENAFTEIHTNLLSTLATQLTTALENARLFHDIRSALEAIEIRERYQSNVGKAVATLSETGTQSLPSVLQAVAEAALCSRIYYAQLEEDDRGQYWHSIADWIDPAMDPELFDKSKILHMPTALFSHWASVLREKSHLALPDQEMSKAEREYLESQGIESMLLFAVPGKHSIPNIMVFEQLNAKRTWLYEEINVLSVAADAISNTIVREDLLDQVQASLDETENLYNASHKLALASDMQEMVAAIALGLRSPVINRGVLILMDSDMSGKVSRMTVEANWYSGHGTPPPPVGTEYVASVYSRFFMQPSAVFHEDVSDPRVETGLRDVANQQNIRSLAILPLWSGKRQIGVLLLESEEKHHFSGREIRSYPPLVDQMAIAVENQRLFNQTQTALSETEHLYQISSSIAQARDAQDLVTLIGIKAMPNGADRTTLVIVNQNNEGEISEFEVVGYYDAGTQYRKLGIHLPASALPFARSIGAEPVIFSDILHSGLDQDSKATLQQLSMIAACFIPLRSAGRLTGMIIASASQVSNFKPEEIRSLQVTGTGIAVALEKQRLLMEAQRRALQLQATAEIARDTTSTLSLDPLLERIVNLLNERFNFYHAAIYLLDESGSFAMIREGTGDAGKQMKAQRYRYPVGSRSIIGEVALHGVPIVVGNLLNNPGYQLNPLLPQTRSEIALPLKLNNRVIGVLDIQSNQLNAFIEEESTVFQILSDQIAVAIDNARSYELAQKAVDEMKEVDRLKSQFLANMSHELRTPLNSIIGFSRVILKGIDGPINETQTQDLSAIYNSGQHLLNLINDILDLSKIEAGKMELAFSDVNLADLVNSVMSTAVGLVKDKPIRLNYHIEPDLTNVQADPTRVRQVLLNFLSNAAKFTDEGSIDVEAKKIYQLPGKPEIIVTVKDSGPGIAEADQSKLFQPFSQVDDSPTRKTGGTGLGLSICRSFIEMHGGRIGLLSSEVGQGSTFYFTLPLEPEEEPTPFESSGEGPRVLCIDDDPQVISLYQRYLQPNGYTVVALTEPHRAIEVARAVKPFAITLDIMMPGKDGWDVITELRNQPDTAAIPVIICSILEEEEKGFSLGAADYLVKPILPDDLTHAVQRFDNDGSLRTVLVIDDDPEDLRLVQKILLESTSYKVILAEGGQAGLEALKQEKPDVIILDLFMPDINGFDLMEKMLQQNPQLTIPIVVLTGADLTADQYRLLSEFGRGLLSKGMLKENDLLAALQKALHQTPQ